MFWYITIQAVVMTNGLQNEHFRTVVLAEGFENEWGEILAQHCVFCMEIIIPE